MKKVLATLLSLLMVLTLVAVPWQASAQAASALAGDYDITVWVGEAAVELTKKQIEDFNNTNEFGIHFKMKDVTGLKNVGEMVALISSMIA